MKKIVSIIILVQALFFGSTAFASNISDTGLKYISNVSDTDKSEPQMLRFYYTLYHNDSLLSSGEQSGYSNSTILFYEASALNDTPSITFEEKGGSNKPVSIKKSNIINELSLNILPASQGGFVSALVTFEYSILNGLTKNKLRVEIPDVRSVMLKQPLYFKNGQSRTISFCLGFSDCKSPDYHLVLKAVVNN